jgi:ActR/RegA family two-component response regulator
LSVAGSLEDLSFPDILQVVHLSRQSGTLVVSAPDGERRVRFRNGLVCDASLGDSSPKLEDILVTRGVVPPAALAPARARQESSGESLAVALVGMGALSQETLDRVVRDELRSLVRSFVLMQEGEFRFEVDEDATPPEDAAVRDGLGPESILTGLPGAVPPRWPAEPPAVNGSLPRRVLVVSERSFLTLSLVEELERDSFEAVTCSSPLVGLDRAREMAGRGEAFFVVADLILPDRTRTGWGGGLELVRGLREIVPEIVVIVVGELQHASVAALARAAGAAGYVPLPDLRDVTFDEAGIRVRDFCVRLGSALCLSDQLSGIDWNAGGRTVRVADPLSLLRGLVGELHASGAGDVTVLVLRLASEYFERAALFALDRGMAVCRGAFGEPLDRRMRGAAIPLTGGSMFERVVAAREGFIGALPADATEEALRNCLGSPQATQSAVLPVISGRDVYGVLYGDNAPSGTPFEDLRALEIFLSQAGLTMQNALLRRRLERLTQHHPAPGREAAA